MNFMQSSVYMYLDTGTIKADLGHEKLIEVRRYFPDACMFLRMDGYIFKPTHILPQANQNH